MKARMPSADTLHAENSRWDSMRLKKGMQLSNRDTGRVKRPGNLTRGLALAGTVLASGIFGCATTPEVKPQSEQTKMKGTKENPYKVYPKQGREESGRGSFELDFPLTFDSHGNGGVQIRVHFNVYLTLSQLRTDTRDATAAELTEIVRETVKRYLDEHGIGILGGISVDMEPAVKSFAKQAATIDVETRTYLESQQPMAPPAFSDDFELENLPPKKEE